MVGHDREPTGDQNFVKTVPVNSFAFPKWGKTLAINISQRELPEGASRMLPGDSGKTSLASQKTRTLTAASSKSRH